MNSVYRRRPWKLQQMICNVKVLIIDNITLIVLYTFEILQFIDSYQIV
jgi:hypothetical protein